MLHAYIGARSLPRCRQSSCNIYVRGQQDGSQIKQALASFLMDDSRSSSLITPEEVSDVTIALHQKGDAALVIHAASTKRFLVSSNVLRLTSRYFESLFSSSFAEGQAVQDGKCPDIKLEDDDPDAMKIILSILHY